MGVLIWGLAWSEPEATKFLMQRAGNNKATSVDTVHVYGKHGKKQNEEKRIQDEGERQE
jgi:hypothetical protein